MLLWLVVSSQRHQQGVSAAQTQQLLPIFVKDDDYDDDQKLSWKAVGWPSTRGFTRTIPAGVVRTHLANRFSGRG